MDNVYALYHHGIKGQKWGVRRFQDKNGRLTAAGRERYNDQTKEHSGLSDKQKKAIKIGAIASGTALVVIGGYHLYKNGKLDKLIDVGKTKVGELLHDVHQGSPSLPKLSKPESLADTLRKANPLRGKALGDNNC